MQRFSAVLNSNTTVVTFEKCTGKVSWQNSVEKRWFLGLEPKNLQLKIELEIRVFANYRFSTKSSLFQALFKKFLKWIPGIPCKRKRLLHTNTQYTLIKSDKWAPYVQQRSVVLFFWGFGTVLLTRVTLIIINVVYLFETRFVGRKKQSTIDFYDQANQRVAVIAKRIYIHTFIVSPTIYAVPIIWKSCYNYIVSGNPTGNTFQLFYPTR